MCMLTEKWRHEMRGRLIGWPNALAADIHANKLFWADAREDYIAYCNFDGTHPQIRKLA